MKLSEMLTAIREYPALKVKYEAMREQQASQERTAVQLSIAYNNLVSKEQSAGSSPCKADPAAEQPGTLSAVL